MTQVGQGEEMEYVETGSDGWVKISIDGEDAYVSQDYVTVEEKLDTAITMTELLYGQGGIRCPRRSGRICKTVHR